MLLSPMQLYLSNKLISFATEIYFYIVQEMKGKKDDYGWSHSSY